MHIPQRFIPNQTLERDNGQNMLSKSQSVAHFKAYRNEDLHYFNEIDNFQTVRSQENRSQYSIEMGSDIAISPYRQHKQHSQTLSYDQNFKIILQNWINKKTLNSNYQARYFVLTPIRLFYFADETKKQLKGCFNFISLLKHSVIIYYSQLQIKIKVDPKGYEQQFGNRYILQLQFSEHSLWVKWRAQIKKILQTLNELYHAGQKSQQIQKLNITMLFPQISIHSLLEMNTKISNQYNCNFWNRLDISQFQLKQYSSHLDILLMRSRHPASYFSRFFMRSYYDHVALILKSQLHQVYVFEAIESRGVCIIDLDTFLKINKNAYEEIAFRKLIVNQSTKQEEDGLFKGIDLQRLEIYLNSLLGKKYQLSLSKLLLDSTQNEVSFHKDSIPPLSGRSNLNPQDSHRRKVQQIIEIEGFKKIVTQNSITYTKVPCQIPVQKQQKTYFCSELVADIFLKFGLIKQGKAKDYWPKDFEEDQIKWRQGTYLSPIMNICINDRNPIEQQR